MSGYALFIQHRTNPGQRNAVEAVWRKHMMPAISANPDHLAYFYAFGEEPDSICAFQLYPNREAAGAFVKTPQYAGYYSEVMPLLLGEPVMTVLDVRWFKPVQP